MVMPADALFAPRLPDLHSFTCPFCLGITATCCRCANHGRVSFVSTLLTIAGEAWARRGCKCEACRAVGLGPK